MSEGIINTTIEILGKAYPIRCPESGLSALKNAADFLDLKMKEVRDSGKAINLERIAIITALNISAQFLELSEQKENLVGKINQRIHQLHQKIDHALNPPTVQTQLLYNINDR